MTAERPDEQSLKAYVNVAADCSRVLKAVCDGGCVPVPDSDRSIDLSMDRNCAQLRKVMLDQIDLRFAAESRNLTRWEQEMGAGACRYVRDEDGENDFDSAAALLCGCVLSVNMLARIYYERHPTCEPLFTVIRRLTELTPPALIALFGDTLPEPVRQTWPHFTGLYEVHCRHQH